MHVPRGDGASPLESDVLAGGDARGRSRLRRCHGGRPGKDGHGDRQSPSPAVILALLACRSPCCLPARVTARVPGDGHCHEDRRQREQVRRVRGHRHRAQGRRWTPRGTGCPFCTNRRVAPSESLAVTHSDIAAQWHPKRNAKTPEDYTYGSHHEAWWQCSIYKTHVWKARISSRTSMLSGCSLCARLAGKGGALRADAEANAVA